MTRDKKNIVRDLKNQKKRRKRLKQKAGQLSKDDLLDILRMKEPGDDAPADEEPAESAK